MRPPSRADDPARQRDPLEAIARALVCTPRLMLFDEATSALDNRTQAVVTASLERLRVTRIVIAHRLSTIRHATRIYVLAGGRIVQQGRFEELAHQEGMFAHLMARQGFGIRASGS